MIRILLNSNLKVADEKYINSGRVYNEWLNKVF